MIASTTNLSFARDVIATPETYLSIIAHLLLVMNCAAVFYLGLRIARATMNVNIAMAAQAGYLLLGYTFPRLVYVSPEAIVIFAAVMAMACLSDVLFANQRPSTFDIVAVPWFIALGVTSKVTFLPLTLAVLLFLNWREILIASALLPFFTLGFLLPMVLLWQPDARRAGGAGPVASVLAPFFGRWSRGPNRAGSRQKDHKRGSYDGDYSGFRRRPYSRADRRREGVPMRVKSRGPVSVGCFGDNIEGACVGGFDRCCILVNSAYAH